MDGSTFDRLTRAVGTAGSRRHLLGLLTSLGLGGLLSALDDAGVAAKRKHGRNRAHHPGKHKRHRKGKRKGNNGGGGGNIGGPGPCSANGGLCQQDSDCCSSNCFNFVCATLQTSCGSGTDAEPCVPPAKGCAGNQCCYGSAACSGSCCQPPANQCNPQRECCAPNCAGRQCGPDGCGAGGTCGRCPANATCNQTTGQCQSSCTPQCQGKQCGDDGCGGSCGTCPTGTTCDATTGQCACAPQCQGKECGSDGCGGSCGSCPPDFICDAPSGQCNSCREVCDPNVICCGEQCCDRGDQTCCNGQCTNVLDDDHNCGACGHQCPAGTRCGGDGVCCMADFGGQCTTVPCCVGSMDCVSGRCCVRSGLGCNQNPAICCSGQCASNGACA